MRKIKIVIILLFIILITGAFTIYICDKKVDNAALGKLYNDVNTIPFKESGILLGTSKYLSNGALNPYYKFRIDAAIELKKSGKIRNIILSGDNSRIAYNEPETMRADLIAAGIDSCSLYLDYAGFRTYDSMVRAKEIFGQEDVTVISQQFHNERALYIAGRENVMAIGFNARDVSRSFGMRIIIREKLARVKVFFDYLVNKKPKFLGEKVLVS